MSRDGSRECGGGLLIANMPLECGRCCRVEIDDILILVIETKCFSKFKFKFLSSFFQLQKLFVSIIFHIFSSKRFTYASDFISTISAKKRTSYDDFHNFSHPEHEM